MVWLQKGILFGRNALPIYVTMWMNVEDISYVKGNNGSTPHIMLKFRIRVTFKRENGLLVT